MTGILNSMEQKVSLIKVPCLTGNTKNLQITEKEEVLTIGCNMSSEDFYMIDPRANPKE